MPPTAKRKTSSRSKPPGHWSLRDAKARFSELVRRAQQDGPQHITVHGRDSVVVVSEAEFRVLTGARSGQLLVELSATSPLRDVEIQHASVLGPVRDVDR